jgi:cytochrome c biogenesis protein ResB
VNKILIAALLVVSLSGCAKTKLVPQLYMPAPPEVLMRAPKDLNTIKQEPKKEEATDEEVQ